MVNFAGHDTSIIVLLQHDTDIYNKNKNPVTQKPILFTEWLLYQIKKNVG